MTELPPAGQSDLPDKYPVEFSTTIMSVVAAAAGSDQTGANAGLLRFLRLYGDPLVRYVVDCHRLTPDDAHNLVHDFLTAKLILAPAGGNLARRFLARNSTQPRVRFRAYLVQSLKNFLLDQRRSPQSPATAPASMEAESNDAAFDQFDIDWAASLLNRTIELVRAECQGKNQEEIWRVFTARMLVPLTTGAAPPPFDDLARELGHSESKTAENLFVTGGRKFRRHLRELIRGYLPHAETVTHPSDEEVQEELDDLQRIILAAAPRHRVRLDCAAEVLGATPEAYDARRYVGLFQLDELRDAWNELLDQPLAVTFANWRQCLSPESGVDWPDMYHLSSQTLRELWRDPRPSLDVLRAIRSFAKRARRVSEAGGSNLPAVPLLGVLYLTAISAAWLRLGERLTRDDESAFIPRLDALLSYSWLDRDTQELGREWRKRLS